MIWSSLALVNILCSQLSTPFPLLPFTSHRPTISIDSSLLSETQISGLAKLDGPHALPALIEVPTNSPTFLPIAKQSAKFLRQFLIPVLQQHVWKLSFPLYIYGWKAVNEILTIPDSSTWCLLSDSVSWNSWNFFYTSTHLNSERTLNKDNICVLQIWDSWRTSLGSPAQNEHTKIEIPKGNISKVINAQNHLCEFQRLYW